MTAPKRTGSPATEPVTLADAKAHLRVDGTDEDAYITGLIGVARVAAEERLAGSRFRHRLGRGPRLDRAGHRRRPGPRDGTGAEAVGPLAYIKAPLPLVTSE